MLQLAVATCFQTMNLPRVSSPVYSWAGLPRTSTKTYNHKRTPMESELMVQLSFLQADREYLSTSVLLCINSTGTCSKVRLVRQGTAVQAIWVCFSPDFAGRHPFGLKV